MAGKLLDANEASRILEIPIQSVSYLANHKDLPALNFGTGWRFEEETLNMHFNDPAVEQHRQAAHP